MHRLFVALRPPPALRRQLLGIMGGVPGARWQDDGQLHLTLRFIGEIDRHQADDVAAALATLRARPLCVALQGVGHFDRNGHGGALWAGVGPREPLAAFARKVDQALVRAGLPPERRAYLPHITLARLGRRAGDVQPFLAAHATLTSDPMTLDAFLLYESHLGSDGAMYEAVQHYPLANT